MSDEPSLEPSVEPSVKEQGARTFSFDVVEICETLSSALAERGVRAKTSAVSDAWLQEADRLFRIDHVVPDEAKMVIEWALADKWWGARLTNMKYFRDKYDTLKLQSGVSHISNNEFDELVEELRRRNSAARG